MARRSRRRFEAILDALGVVAVVADIGAGDLDLARLALARGRAGHVIAVERAKGAYERALARSAGDGRVQVRLGDGFDPIGSGEVGAAVLAGMGGAAMAGILLRARRHDAAALPPRLVLGPTSDAGAVRSALFVCGFRDVADTVVVEGRRLRVVIRAERGGAGARPTAGELQAGTLLRPCGEAPLRAAYLAERLMGWRREVQGADPARRSHLVAAIAEVEASL